MISGHTFTFHPIFLHMKHSELTGMLRINTSVHGSIRPDTEYPFSVQADICMTRMVLGVSKHFNIGFKLCISTKNTKVSRWQYRLCDLRIRYDAKLCCNCMS